MSSVRCCGGRSNDWMNRSTSTSRKPPQVGDRDGVLEPREGRLTGEVGIVGEAVGDELEDGVGPQGVVVVLVLVIGEDAVDPLPDHAQERLLGERRIASVVEGGGELFGEPDLLIELPDREEPGVAGQRGEEETSISTGRDGKKSNDNSGTDCRLIGGPRVDV